MNRHFLLFLQISIFEPKVQFANFGQVCGNKINAENNFVACLVTFSKLFAILKMSLFMPGTLPAQVFKAILRQRCVWVCVGNLQKQRQIETKRNLNRLDAEKKVLGTNNSRCKKKNVKF